MLQIDPAPLVAPGDVLLPRFWRVERTRRETADTYTLDLLPPGGSGAFHFAPGQFNMLYAFGVGESAISISGDPGVTTYLTHTIRRVGGVTQTLERLHRGALVGVRGPFGTAWPVDQARGNDVVLVAGGIGLAPLRPALYHILAHRDDYGSVSLLYGARTADDILYRDEIRVWRGRLDLHVDITVDRGLGRWRGRVGVVTTLVPHAPFDPANSLALICGPEVMIRATAQALRERGVAAENLHVSLERNMKCAVGFCGHCQFGPEFICKDGPVFPYDRVSRWMGIREW